MSDLPESANSLDLYWEFQRNGVENETAAAILVLAESIRRFDLAGGIENGLDNARAIHINLEQDSPIEVNVAQVKDSSPFAND